MNLNNVKTLPKMVSEILILLIKIAIDFDLKHSNFGLQLMLNSCVIRFQSCKVQWYFKNLNSCLNTNIYSYMETSGCQSFNLYLNVVHLFTPVLIRHLWQLKTVVFLHWGVIHALLFNHVFTATEN
jgi:hypothetical protein